MSALSSATRTVGRDRSDDIGDGSHGADLDASILDVEAHRPASLPADRLAQDGDFGFAQRAARRDDVPLAHLDGAWRHELREHARAAGEFGDEPARIGAQRLEALDE